MDNSIIAVSRSISPFWVGTYDKAQLQLLDELGKVVLEETLSTKSEANNHTVAIPKYWSGTFFVRLQMGKDVVTGKFVKQ